MFFVNISLEKIYYSPISYYQTYKHIIELFTSHFED